MENKKELKTISFQLESKCKRGLEPIETYVPKFNCKEVEKDANGNVIRETKYNAVVKVSLKDLEITDTYFACLDNTLYNVPFEVVKGLPLATVKAFFTGKNITGVGCSVSGYKGVISNVHEEVNENNETITLFDITLDRQLHYIIQE